MNTLPFPKHDIDPKLKNKDWHLQVARAMWSGWSQGMPTNSIFYAKRQKYSEIRDYALNKQTTGKYMKALTGEENPESVWINIDTSPDAIVKTHRQKLLGRIKSTQYNITATPIDPLARDKMTEYYDKIRVKIMLREEMAKQNPELASHPALQPEPDEPKDMEELEMELNTNPKFIRAKDAEMAIAMLFYQNTFDRIQDLVDEDLVDFGVGIIHEQVDEAGKVTISYVPPYEFICSHSRDGYFENLSYAGHIEYVSLSQLVGIFSKDEIEKLAAKNLNRWGNPSAIPSNPNDIYNPYDAFKVPVLNYEYKSYDMVVHEEKKNRRGNIKFYNASLSRAENSADPNRFVARNYETMYTGKWVIDTDMIYKFGKATNQKRSLDPREMTKTTSSYHVQAASFDKMVAKGITEDLIPIADAIQNCLYKLRNLNARMIINGLSIDFTALEGVAMGATGGSLTPRENLDMFFQTGILGVRSDLITQDGKNQRKAVEALMIPYMDQFNALWLDYQHNVNRMYDLSGLNQTTDSASVNPKMLVGIANAQNSGTNNALYFIINARRTLFLKAAKGALQRLQTALLNAPYQGYVQTIGQNTLELLKFTEENLPYDYDIMIEDRPTDEQRQILYESMKKDIEQGLITSSEVMTVMNTFNLKQAQMIFDYKVKKARERQQEFSMQQQQQNGQIQTQSALAVEQAKQQTLQLQLQADLMKIQAEKEWDYKIKQLELTAKGQHIQDKEQFGMVRDMAKAMPQQQPQPPQFTPEQPEEMQEPAMPQMQ